VKRTLTYFYFIFILITNKTYSQQNDKIEGTISGYVIDNHTKANLQGANIYLIGTKLGTSTD
jgi:hypothetical protein